MPRRRLTTAFCVSFIILTIVIISIRSSSAPTVRVPTVADLSQGAKQVAGAVTNPKLPELWNPFSQSAHKPPEQADSSNGATKWYSDLRWLNPFSSETTLDNERALLPPLPPRQTIYTFYEPSQDPAVVTAEHALLLTWRRAWWAKGFKPIVLGRAEAAKHPLYNKVQKLNLNSKLEKEAMRWLAWAHMGGGTLMNWLALPMTELNDPVLLFLKRGKFDPLLKFRGLANGVLCGESHKIEIALEEFVNVSGSAEVQTFLDALSLDSVQVVDPESAIAFYDKETITFHYDKIRDELQTSQAAGLQKLQQLINAHLHTTWQAGFPNGIAVLKPHPDKMTAMIAPALRLARDLIACPASPVPSSCPPSNPKCKACSGAKSDLTMTTPSTFRNSSTTFTIGTVPHPYTFTTIKHNLEVLDVQYVRRHTERDQWINATTSEMLGHKLNGAQRLVSFKEVVASPSAIAHSLWITAERAEAIQRDWLLGFELPSTRGGGPPDLSNTAGISASQFAKERSLLELARETLANSKSRPIINTVQAWNLADAEAWVFVQAFQVRRRTEREKWEAQESKFAGAEGKRAAD